MHFVLVFVFSILLCTITHLFQEIVEEVGKAEKPEGVAGRGCVDDDAVELVPAQPQTPPEKHTRASSIITPPDSEKEVPYHTTVSRSAQAAAGTHVRKRAIIPPLATSTKKKGNNKPLRINFEVVIPQRRVDMA